MMTCKLFHYLRRALMPVVILAPMMYIDAKTVNHCIKIEGSDATLTQFIPLHTDTPSTTVIICPGGSYFWLSREREGTMVAQWLQSNGIAAFVLDYSTAGILPFITRSRLLFGGKQYPTMIRELQSAILYVRGHATELNVNIHRLGVMGFSAGGHLALMSGEMFSTDFLQCGAAPSMLRPDFIAAIYPVVTLSDNRYVHKRSRRGLLGERHEHNHALCDSLSVERHVNKNNPPVFIINCADDRVVRYQNSILMDSALTAHHIRHQYIRYATGNHGFGADDNKATNESKQWKVEFIKWIRKIY